MAGFNIVEALRILTPNLVFRAVVYPYRAAYHIARSMEPRPTGLTFWQAFYQLTKLSLPEPTISAPETFQMLGRLPDEEQGDHFITLKGQGGAVRIRPLTETMLHIRASREGSFSEPFSYGVIKPEDEWSGAAMAVQESASALELSMGDLLLVLDRASGDMALSYRGQQLFKTTAGAVAYQPETGEVLWRALFDKETAFYGLGERTGPLNQAGRRAELWNYDPAGYDRDTDPIYMNIPFLLALSGGQAVGLFFDNPHRTWLDLGASTPGAVEYRAQGGEFRLYIMVGSPQEVLQQYTELTGRISLPPLWAFGFHQARWSYYPQARVMEIAQEFRKRRLPCDVIHLDIHYMNDYRCFTWHPERFPDPQGMLSALHQTGFKVVTIIDPGIRVDRNYWVYREGVKQDAFMKYPDGTRFVGPVWPGDCHFPDFTDPAVRRWWGELYRGLLADGVDGFWNDMNEPALITTQQGATMPGVVRHSCEGQGGAHREVHNLYGMQMVRASAEGVRRLRPGCRPYLITRSGWAGVQRYSSHWTADNKSTWDHLRLSIQMVLTLGLSGVPITGPDIGGFTGGPSSELFARWMQVGALLPFFRVHSMIKSPNQEPWEFGPEIEMICRKYLELRYRLLPYIYTAAWQASQTGIPLVRALSFMYPDDKQTYSIDDEYLFGDSLLVAPVTDEGAVSRDVYLPAGDWYDFWTHRCIEGGSKVTVSAPLDFLPILVKAGTVLPLWPIQQYVGERRIDTLTLHAFAAPGRHNSLLYEDDGESPDYKNPSAHRLSEFSLEQNDTQRIISLRREIQSGAYQASSPSIELRLVGTTVDTANIDIRGGELLGRSVDNENGEPLIQFGAADTFELELRGGSR